MLVDIEGQGHAVLKINHRMKPQLYCGFFSCNAIIPEEKNKIFRKVCSHQTISEYHFPDETTMFHFCVRKDRKKNS